MKLKFCKNIKPSFWQPRIYHTYNFLITKTLIYETYHYACFIHFSTVFFQRIIFPAKSWGQSKHYQCQLNT